MPSSSPVATKVNAGFYAKMQDKGFGDLYRGWGGFVYNAADGRYAKPIDESLLKLPKSEKDRLDPMKMVFTPLGTDLNTLSRWTGQRTEIYLTATEAGTARLTEQDVVLGNLFGEMANDNTVSGDCYRDRCICHHTKDHQHQHCHTDRCKYAHGQQCHRQQHH